VTALFYKKSDRHRFVLKKQLAFIKKLFDVVFETILAVFGRFLN
jgi:hypothetical protein